MWCGHECFVMMIFKKKSFSECILFSMEAHLCGFLALEHIRCSFCIWSMCASYVQKQPYQTCTLSMWVYYVKGLSALKLELAWRDQSKFSARKTKCFQVFFPVWFFSNLDYELSFCQANYLFFIKSFVGLKQQTGGGIHWPVGPPHFYFVPPLTPPPLAFEYENLSSKERSQSKKRILQKKT